jgi:DNA-3-methyladenine glycosylase II
LEDKPSPEAAKLLCRIKGIGPWTAAVILLRGLGRLDVFP